MWLLKPSQVCLFFIIVFFADINILTSEFFTHWSFNSLLSCFLAAFGSSGDQGANKDLQARNKIKKLFRIRDLQHRRRHGSEENQQMDLKVLTSKAPLSMFSVNSQLKKPHARLAWPLNLKWKKKESKKNKWVYFPSSSCNNVATLNAVTLSE